tara:strand:- start:652 stop:765 length:114 start_codon:yes stop_codon:yes gene_type:complete
VSENKYPGEKFRIRQINANNIFFGFIYIDNEIIKGLK